MKLVDLHPKWVMKDVQRIGFTFVSPTNPKWRQSCFAVKASHKEQRELFLKLDPNPDNDKWLPCVQGCNPECAWTIEGGIENASFETMTVTPSLDGSAGGLWHGHITNGQIVGGLP